MTDKPVRSSAAAVLARDEFQQFASLPPSRASRISSASEAQSRWWEPIERLLSPREMRRPRLAPARCRYLDNRAAAALADERQRSGRTGAYALTLAYAALAVWCALVHPWPGAIFYVALVAGFTGLAAGWAWMSRRATSSWLVLSFVLANAVLLTITLLVPNPFDPPPWPIQMKLRPLAFPFFILLIAWATFTLSPVLVLATTLIIAGTWSFGVALVALQPGALLGFGLPGGSPEALARYLDPRFIDTAGWASNIFAGFLIAGVLAVIVSQIQRLIKAQARIERTRDNLARFVPANLVDELAEVDEPFGPVRTQRIAVLFVDIVGFTALCEVMSPHGVIQMLRGFHQRMADCVFEHGGTLDKFVGDSVMATFGTPRPGTRDASNALACAESMLGRLKPWNAQRSARGEPAVNVGIGLHFGPVVLGEIGNEQRLELAVLGDTVNTASRLEALTRRLGTSLIASQDLIARVREEKGEPALELVPGSTPVVVRGRTRPIEIWTLKRRSDAPLA